MIRLKPSLKSQKQEENVLKEIKNSKKEREENVKFALAINALDGGEPSKKGMELLQNYIDGKTQSRKILRN